MGTAPSHPALIEFSQLFGLQACKILHIRVKSNKQVVIPQDNESKSMGINRIAVDSVARGPLDNLQRGSRFNPCVTRVQVATSASRLTDTQV